jgi:hypothetical protein
MEIVWREALPVHFSRNGAPQGRVCSFMYEKGVWSAMSRNNSKLKSVVTVPPGTVQKVIKPYFSGQLEKAEIA